MLFFIFLAETKAEASTLAKIASGFFPGLRGKPYGITAENYLCSKNYNSEI